MQGASCHLPQCPRGTPVLCPQASSSQTMATARFPPLAPSCCHTRPAGKPLGSATEVYPGPSHFCHLHWLMPKCLAGLLVPDPQSGPFSLPWRVACSFWPYFWLTPQCSQGGPLALCTGAPSAWSLLPLSQGCLSGASVNPTLRGPPSQALLCFGSKPGSSHRLRLRFNISAPAHCLSSH